MGESIVLPWLTGIVEKEPKKVRISPKRAGEFSEAAFLLKAESMGFRVAKPWGDSEKYDFILDSGERLWRVQLKSTEQIYRRGYSVQPIYGVYGKGKVGYTEDEIDVLVVHIRPRDVWYVIPVEKLLFHKSLRFYPDIACKSAQWEGYRDAWGVIGGVESFLQ